MTVRRRLSLLAVLLALAAALLVPAAPASASGSPPVASWDRFEGRQRQKLAVEAPGVLGNDTDPEGDQLSARLVDTGPDHGRVELHEDGSFVYAPDVAHPGYDSFLYQAFDGTSWSSPQYVWLTLWGDPIAYPDRYALLGQRVLDVPAESGPLTNDAGQPPLRMQLTARPRHGMVSIGRDGSFRYVAFRGFTGTDTFEYRARDALGVSSKPTEVTIRVALTNTAPAATPDAYEVMEDSSLSVDAPGLLGNDVDADGDPLRVEVVAWPDEGSLDAREDGSFTFRTDRNQDNNAFFSYRVTDDFSWSEPVTVFIDVVAVNDPPIPEGDSYWLLQGEVLSIGAPGVLENDVDPVEFDIPIVWALETPPQFGKLTLETDGSFVYEPDADFVGTDSFVYRVGDSGGPGTTAFVSLDVAQP